MRHCKQTVFLILLMLVLLLPLASAEGRTFITVDGCVPLEIREDSAVTAEEIIVPKSGNTINPQFGDQISPSLTNGDTVVAGDISSLRVLLLLGGRGREQVSASRRVGRGQRDVRHHAQFKPAGKCVSGHLSRGGCYLSVSWIRHAGICRIGCVHHGGMDGRGRVGRDRCDGRVLVLRGLRRRAVRCPGLLGRGRAANDFAGCNT